MKFIAPAPLLMLATFAMILAPAAPVRAPESTGSKYQPGWRVASRSVYPGSAHGASTWSMQVHAVRSLAARSVSCLAVAPGQ